MLSTRVLQRSSKLQQFNYAATGSKQEQTQHSLTRWREKPVEYYLEYPRIVSPLLSGQSWILWSPAVSHTSRGPPLCHIQVVGPPLCHIQVDVLVPLPAVPASTVHLIGLFYTGQSWISWSPAVSHTSRGPPLCHIQVVGPPLCHIQVGCPGPPACSPRLYRASNWTLLYRSELDFVVPRCVTYKSWSPTVSHSSRRSPTVSHSSRMSLVPQSAVLVASTVPRLIGLYYAGQSWISWSPAVSHTSRGPPLCHIQVVGPPLCHIQVGCLWSPSLQSSSPLLCLD